MATQFLSGRRKLHAKSVSDLQAQWQTQLNLCSAQLRACDCETTLPKIVFTAMLLRLAREFDMEDQFQFSQEFMCLYGVCV